MRRLWRVEATRKFGKTEIANIFALDLLTSYFANSSFRASRCLGTPEHFHEVFFPVPFALSFVRTNEYIFDLAARNLTHEVTNTPATSAAIIFNVDSQFHRFNFFFFFFAYKFGSQTHFKSVFVWLSPRSHVLYSSFYFLLDLKLRLKVYIVIS